MKTNTQARGIKSWTAGLICSRSDRSPAFAISEWLCSFFFHNYFLMSLHFCIKSTIKMVVVVESRNEAVKRIAGVCLFVRVIFFGLYYCQF